MFNFVPTSLLADRLDAEYYSEDQISNQRILEEFGVNELTNVCHSINVGFTGELTSIYVQSGVPLYRVSDIDDIFLNEVDVNYVPQEFAKDTPQIAIEDGDLVLAAVGNTIGKAAIKGGNISNGVCSRALMIARPKHDLIDAYFLISHISTKFGQKSLLRGVSGSAQPVLNTPLIAGLSVPKINKLCQKYIGDKVRQAEWFRAWAAKIQAESTSAMPVFKPLINHYTKNSFRVPLENVIATRLDSSFSHPDHRSLDQMMKKNGCNTLGKNATPVKAGWNKKAANTFLYYEIGGLNVANGTISPVETLTSEAPSRATTQIKQGDVLISTVRPNRRNVGFVIEDAQDKPMIATSGFSVLRFETLADAAFYHSWLRTEDATSQLMRWNSGSAYPAIDEDVPLHILVPEFEASLREMLGQALLDTHFALWFSKKLTNAAKFLVEALIEGQLTEADLIIAEQALQAGNNQLDRQILNRLKTDGVDGQGQALFSDLDQLYSLLEQASQS